MYFIFHHLLDHLCKRDLSRIDSKIMHDKIGVHINFFCFLSKTLCLIGQNFVRRNYSLGEIFVTFQKIRHFRPSKFRPVRYEITPQGGFWATQWNEIPNNLEIMTSLVVTWMKWAYICPGTINKHRSFTNTQLKDKS